MNERDRDEETQPKKSIPKTEIALFQDAAMINNTKRKHEAPAR